ncbi:MAG: fumarate hydratase [Spirochaetales bacterium]|nr:fumarate hydratase [Spirochaetales bacterium]
MREIEASQITSAVKQLFIKASYHLPEDVKNALLKAIQNETTNAAKQVLEILLKNAQIAAQNDFPLCQDTGMAFVFVELGQDVHICGGLLEDAVNAGVEQAYDEGFLRKSVVEDPLRRKNTGNNLPAVIFTEIVAGDKIKLTVMPKGFGAENQSRLKMMIPATTPDEIVDFIANEVIASGSKGCPPAVIGVGIGGSFDTVAHMAKKALLLPIDGHNEDPFYADMEKKILEKINNSGIGPMGVGGRTTVLSVRILAAPTHIAGLPLAYNYCCHSTRHADIEL